MTRPPTTAPTPFAPQEIRLLALSGSLRRDSLNHRLLRSARYESPHGVRLDIWPGLRSVPPYSEDDDTHPAPAAVAKLRTAIAAADGLLIATPEYNRSIPGQLKNALDWASRPWRRHVLDGKPVAVIGSSPSPRGAGESQAETRKILAAIGARVVDDGLILGHAHEAFGDSERLVDADARRQLAEVLASLIAACRERTASALLEI